MIPNKVHYIWLGGGRHSQLMDVCILSWHKHLSNFEIIEWNEENLNIDKKRKECNFLDECLKRGMWAIASDYIRLKVLYEEGGIYLDTDMQILNNIQNLYDGNNDMLICEETKGTFSCGIMGFEKHHPYVRRILEFYENEIMSDNSGLVTIPCAFNRLQKVEYIKNAIILPPEYFYPFYFNEDFTINCIKDNTYGIHWWSKNWGSKCTEYVFWNTKHLMKNKLKFRVAVVRKTIGFYYHKII